MMEGGRAGGDGMGMGLGQQLRRTLLVRPKNLSGSFTSIWMGSSAEMDLTLRAVRASSLLAPAGTSTGSDADTFTYSTCTPAVHCVAPPVRRLCHRPHRDSGMAGQLRPQMSAARPGLQVLPVETLMHKLCRRATRSSAIGLLRGPSCDMAWVVGPCDTVWAHVT